MAPYRVLIVDDQKDIRRLFAEALRSLSKEIDILEMPSAEEALFVTAGTHVDLLITDVYLPGISGLEMVRRLKKSNPSLKIILVTGASDPKVKDEVASAGASAFFYKPVDIRELMETVKQYSEATEVETIPVEPVSAEQELKAPPAALPSAVDLVSSLSELKELLKAKAAALISDEGIILAHTGEFPAKVAPDLVKQLSTVFKAGWSVARSLKPEEPENLMGFAGPDYTLCMVPVGERFSLVVIGGQAFQASLLSPGRRMLASAAELLKILEQPKSSPAVTALEPEQLADQPPEEIPLVEVKPEDAEFLNALFTHSTEKSLEPTEVDNFWSTLAEQSETDGSADQDIISYEEAQKRGLTPE